MSIDLDKSECSTLVENIDKPFYILTELIESFRALSFRQLDPEGISGNTRLNNIVQSELREAMKKGELTARQRKKRINNISLAIFALAWFIILPAPILFPIPYLSGNGRLIVLIAVFIVVLLLTAGVFIVHKMLYRKFADDEYNVYLVDGCSIAQFKQELERNNYTATVLSDDLDRTDGIYVIMRINHRMLIINKCDCE